MCWPCILELHVPRLVLSALVHLCLFLEYIASSLSCLFWAFSCVCFCGALQGMHLLPATTSLLLCTNSNPLWKVRLRQQLVKAARSCLLPRRAYRPWRRVFLFPCLCFCPCLCLLQSRHLLFRPSICFCPFLFLFRRGWCCSRRLRRCEQNLSGGT